MVAPSIWQSLARRPPLEQATPSVEVKPGDTVALSIAGHLVQGTSLLMQIEVSPAIPPSQFETQDRVYLETPLSFEIRSQ